MLILNILHTSRESSIKVKFFIVYKSTLVILYASTLVLFHILYMLLFWSQPKGTALPGYINTTISEQWPDTYVSNICK